MGIIHPLWYLLIMPQIICLESYAQIIRSTIIGLLSYAQTELLCRESYAHTPTMILSDYPVNHMPTSMPPDS